MRVREAPGGGMRGGERRQQGDALRSGRRVGEQPDSGGAAREHEPAARVGSGAQLLEQRRLPDPRLADDFEHGRSVPRELGQHRLQRLELGGAPDDLLGRQSHGRVPSL